MLRRLAACALSLVSEYATSLFDLRSSAKDALTLLVLPAGAMATYPTCLKFSTQMPTGPSTWGLHGHFRL